MRRQPIFLPQTQPPRITVDLFEDYEESTPAFRTSAPFLCESRGRLSMHFDTSGVQSLMDTADPNRLMLGYTRTIMHFLQFQPNPRHLAMVGLGGGSLAKYCHHHLPETRITAAEISPEVIELRADFHIPSDSPRFQVVCEDGATFVPRHESVFDVLIIDGFDSAGQPSDLCSQDFYKACRRALTPEGLLVVNICDSGRSILIARLRKVFERRVLVMDGEDSTNTIAFASNSLPDER